MHFWHAAYRWGTVIPRVPDASTDLAIDPKIGTPGNAAYRRGTVISRVPDASTGLAIDPKICTRVIPYPFTPQRSRLTICDHRVRETQ